MSTNPSRAVLAALCGALLSLPTRAAAQELTTVFCNDTPLDFLWIVRWQAPLVGTPPVRAPLGGTPTIGGIEGTIGSFQGGNCGTEWFLAVSRGNFASEGLVGPQLFDEFIFSARHLVPPATPDHDEGPNPGRIIFHVDGGILAQLGAAPNSVPVPEGAMKAFDAASLPAGADDPVAQRVPHKNEGHADVGFLEYQTTPDAINFTFRGSHVVPEPSTLLLLASGLAAITVAGSARHARRRAVGPRQADRRRA